MESSVTIVNKSSLRPGQRRLYELIVEKLNRNDPVTLKEATDIWLSRVHGDVRDGVPYYWDYYAGRYEENGQVYYRGATKPMTDWHIQARVLDWLMKNIGLLVIRGYLKVIPMIDVKKLT